MGEGGTTELTLNEILSARPGEEEREGGEGGEEGGRRGREEGRESGRRGEVGRERKTTELQEPLNNCKLKVYILPYHNSSRNVHSQGDYY